MSSVLTTVPVFFYIVHSEDRKALNLPVPSDCCSWYRMLSLPVYSDLGIVGALCLCWNSLKKLLLLTYQNKKSHKFTPRIRQMDILIPQLLSQYVYLHSLSELCSKLDFVPLSEFVPCSSLHARGKNETDVKMSSSSPLGGYAHLLHVPFQLTYNVT